MGAWGYRPEDNDGAWDVFGAARETKDPSSSIINAFKGRCDTDEKWARIGGLFLGLREGWRFKRQILNKVDLYLTAIENDKDWLKGWREPKEMAKSLRETASILNALYQRRNPFERSDKPSKVGIGGI